MILSHQEARLRQARYTLGLSQIAFAAALGVQQTSVSRWETSGRIHARNMKRIDALLAAQERHLGAPIPAIAFEAACLARDVLRETKAGMLASRQLKAQAERVLDLTRSSQS